MEQSVSSAQQSNMSDSKRKQIRLLILAIIVFLASLITNYQILKNRAEEQKQAASSVTQSKIQQSSVSLKKEYQNPFDKNTQYVNPFSQYKNPFDSLK